MLLTLLAILVHGYHLGVEDQSIYLPAIKKLLDPQLFPHDSQFFTAQTHWTIFDDLVAASVRITGLRVDLVIFLWHLLGIFLFLLGCLCVSRRVFAEPAAQWAGVAVVAATLTIPIAGTLALMADQYLHPRIFAHAFVLFALAAILDRTAWSFAWIALAAVIHPQVTFFAVAHLAFQAWRAPVPGTAGNAAAAILLPGSPTAMDAWREVLLTRRHHFPLRWTWYEWLGAWVPIVLLAWFSRLARRGGKSVLEHVSSRLALSCTLGIVAAVMINATPTLLPFMPTQPMRQLHLVYILLFLLGGGLLGELVLRNRSVRWALLLVPLCGAAFCIQRAMIFPASAHIEWPAARPANEWLLAFEWIRGNTPKDALFALDPRYKERVGEDNHGFRAWAERSMLADYTKDRGVAAMFPTLAEEWKRQVDDRKNWTLFKREDFRRLRAKYGVTWIVFDAADRQGQPMDAELPCPFRNARVQVCRVE